jgi:multicomponent K+:H+ antiporter subunit A
VFGATVLMLTALAHQSVRGHRAVPRTAAAGTAVPQAITPTAAVGED